jgi:hypothetical protein
VIKKMVLTIILSLVIGDAFLVGWNRGYDLGYESALTDVMLGFQDPLQYFMTKLGYDKRIKHGPGKIN